MSNYINENFTDTVDSANMQWLVYAPYSQTPAPVTPQMTLIESQVGILAPRFSLQGGRFPNRPRPKVGVAAFPTVSFSFVGYRSDQTLAPQTQTQATGASLLGSANGNFNQTTGISTLPPWSGLSTVIDLSQNV